MKPADADQRHPPDKEPRAPEPHPRGQTGPPGGKSAIGQEPQGVQKDIADADKRARTGTTEEPVRNTPPAGAWNDTSAD